MRSVVSHNFSPQVSWSKVVALFAFAARLAAFCREHESRIGADRVFDVAYVLAQFAVERLTPFLKRNGGWVSKFLLSFTAILFKRKVKRVVKGRL